MRELLSKYSFTFPKELIANEPVIPRDKARLLVYDRSSKSIQDLKFADLPNLIPKGSVLVFNRTKVFPARVKFKKQTGGVVEVLFTGFKGKFATALANKPLKSGDVIFDPEGKSAEVLEKNDKEYKLSSRDISFLNLVYKHGSMPLPPYIKNTKLTKRMVNSYYQTVYASKEGSVAAPTAGLHFTNRLLQKLKANGVRLEYITLHVGLGTFAKLTEENIASGKLHEESYEIPAAVAKRLWAAKKRGQNIYAVGTTTVRALESASSGAHGLVGLKGKTSLFMRPPYEPKFVNGLITNFHVPESSLLMLVSCFVEREKLLSLYRYAVSQRYRLFSFGDGMFIR